MRTQWKQAALAKALHVSLCVFTLPLVATAQTGPTVQTWNVEAGSLQQAISRVMRQGRLTISYPSELVTGKTTPGLSGTHTPREALERLLEGSGIEVEAVNDTSFVLRRSGEQGMPKAVSPSRRITPPVDPVAEKQTRTEEPIDIAPVVVTGTRIRGGVTPSPVITIGAESIREEGFADLGEAIRSVPQNFTGGQNPGVLMGNVTGDMINQNATGGSGLNLRGLGPDASLTLLNGRRMSYGGFVQSVDISAIPVEAVERVEIVADGASAIYGSDAVGGVGNVVLKRDFEGFALGARYGAATDGGLATHEYNATTGTTWAKGGLIATYRDVSADPIYARQRHYTAELPSPSTIYPDSELRSGLFSAHHAVGDIAEMWLDALRTERDQLYYFFSTDTIYNRLMTQTTTTYVAPSIDVLLPGSWRISVGGAWGKDDLISDHSRLTVGTGQISPLINDCFCNKSRGYDVTAEGPLFAIGGGDVRLAVGAGRRINDFVWHNRITDSLPTDARESSRFVYAEANFPFVRSGEAAVGVRRLELTAAVRGEDYDSFGRVSTPKLGLIFDPNANITLKTSWGKSFKAPTLLERHRPMVGVAIHPSAFGGEGYAADDVLLFMNGGNPNLKPERARTWLVSLALHPVAISGLDVELTWFDIGYSDRVIQPLTGPGYFTDPVNAEYLDRSPTAERVAGLLAAVDSISNYTDAEFDPERVVATLDGRYVNTVWQKIRGMDLSGSYRFRLGRGQMTIRGSASWLDSSQQTMGMAHALDLTGRLGNPAKINGRLGTVWLDGGFSASAFVSYVGPVSNPNDNDDGASFTTFDTTLRYRVEQQESALSGFEFALAATNLLDRAPPLYVTYPFVARYDSTNYSAIGRFVSLSVTRRW